MLGSLAAVAASLGDALEVMVKDWISETATVLKVFVLGIAPDWLRVRMPLARSVMVPSMLFSAEIALVMRIL